MCLLLGPRGVCCRPCPNFCRSLFRGAVRAFVLSSCVCPSPLPFHACVGAAPHPTFMIRIRIFSPAFCFSILRCRRPACASPHRRASTASQDVSSTGNGVRSTALHEIYLLWHRTEVAIAAMTGPSVVDSGPKSSSSSPSTLVAASSSYSRTTEWPPRSRLCRGNWRNVIARRLLQGRPEIRFVALADALGGRSELHTGGAGDCTHWCEGSEASLVMASAVLNVLAEAVVARSPQM